MVRRVAISSVSPATVPPAAARWRTIPATPEPIRAGTVRDNQPVPGMKTGADLPPSAPDVSQIAPRLWVGAALDSLDHVVGSQQAEHLAAHSAVGLVIDCRLGADDSDVWMHLRQVEYVNIGVEDAGEPLPDQFFTEGVERVLGHWTRARSSVLIHCKSGAHRSPAIELAVLLVDGRALDVAVWELTSARASVHDRYFADAARWHATCSE